MKGVTLLLIVLFVGDARASCESFVAQIDNLKTYLGRHPERRHDPAVVRQLAELEKSLDACNARAEEIEEAERQRRQNEREMETARAAAEAKAAQDAEAARAAILRDPKRLAVIFGAALCIDRRVRSEARMEISKEKKYARLGGIIDKERLYELQQRVRWADEHEAADRKNLRMFRGLKAAPCTNPQVTMLVTCQLEQTTCDKSVADLEQFIATPDDE